jgi:hypothetical protein
MARTAGTKTADPRTVAARAIASGPRAQGNMFADTDDSSVDTMLDRIYA